MVEWGRAGETITATGRDGEVQISAEGWEPGPPECQLPYPVDAALAGRARGLHLPEGAVSVVDGSGSQIAAEDAVHGGEFALSVDADVETVARFAGAATVDDGGDGGDGVTVTFPEASPVSIGFRERRADPETVSVPRSPGGVAAAVTAAAGDLADAGPARSRPSARAHPPIVEFDESATVPTATRSIVFRVPADLEHVLVAAPFAYYLGAELVTERRSAPLLEIPDVGFERPYGELPTFAPQVASDCRQAFYLDCLTRESPPGRPLDRTSLTALGLDAAAVREASPGVRYATYLDAPVDPGDLPEWHLSTYVDATYDHAGSLPYLLDRLSLVYPAESSAMEPRDLLERSLDDFYRGEVVSVSPVAPDLGAGSSHAWLADGEPVDAFKTSTTAHENRLATGTDREAMDVEVVVNDPEMAGELAVADTYRETPLPVSVSVRESLEAADLAAVLERDTDFVHFVGHCEVDGLRCPDGHLSATSLDRSGATTFFLNACGSYHEGETLVAKGSVAGGVTLDKVLNEQATRVGTAFGRLLVNGFGLDRALSLARRRIMMGRDYAVVGDGTFALAPTCGHPAVMAVEACGSEFTVEYDVVSARAAGASYRDPLTDRHRLYGDCEPTNIGRGRLLALLERSLAPVTFDGDLHWSDDLAAAIRRGDFHAL